MYHLWVLREVSVLVFIKNSDIGHLAHHLAGKPMHDMFFDNCV